MEKAIDAAAAGGDWRDQKTWYTYETLTLKIARAIIGAIALRVARVRVEGFENVPAGPCVLACNHLSNADPIFMATTLPRHPYFMAKMELFKNPLLGWFYRQAGGFPVYRGEGDEWAIARAGKVLEAGEVLAIFPEGKRSKHGQLVTGKTGMARLALKHQVPVVPMAIWGTERIAHGGRPQFERPTVRMTMGQPIDLAAIAPAPPYDAAVYQQMTTVVMRAIAQLMPDRYRGPYA